MSEETNTEVPDEEKRRLVGDRLAERKNRHFALQVQKAAGDEVDDEISTVESQIAELEALLPENA